MGASPLAVAKQGVRGALGRLGYELRRVTPYPAGEDFPPDLDDHARLLCERVRPFTLTSVERIVALRDAVRYVSRGGIRGDICECGVWRGGSMMVIAITLVELGDTTRDLYMFDTFTRPPDTGPRDGPDDQAELDEALTKSAYSYLPLDEVRRLVEATGYPADKLHFIQGLVEETLPDGAPSHVSLLRLDTDYYSSTAHELTHLYPLISDGGVLIIDDYGQYVGARQAVDEYFEGERQAVLLNRIDATGRLVVVRNRESAPR